MEKSNNKRILTMYIGDPQSVSAITPPSRNRAKPKSAAKKSTEILLRALRSCCSQLKPAEVA